MIKIPSNYELLDVQNIMMNQFLEYKLSSKSFPKVKVRVGKNKGSMVSQFFINKSVFNKCMVKFFEHPDGSKSIELVNTMDPIVSMLLVLLTGVLIGLIVILILTRTVYSRKTKEMKDILNKELNNTNS